MASSVKSVSLSFQTLNTTNSVQSFELSKMYVGRFLKLGVLNIIYRRISINESEFEPEKYENVDYVQFKSKSTNKFIKSYHIFTHAIMDGLEKDYLKKIFLFIFDKGTRDILETYSFKLKYNKEISKTKTDPKLVRDATVDLFQNIANLPGKKWSSDDVDIFMEFKFNQGTPREYEPPYFQPALEPICTAIQSNMVMSLGNIHTGFHKVIAYGSGNNFSLSRESTPAPENFNEQEQPSGLLNKRNNLEDEHQNKKKLKINHSNASNISGQTSIENITILSSDEFVSCACKWDLPKEFKIIRCTLCNEFVHLACHGYITLNAIDQENFVCNHCVTPKPNLTKMNRLIKLRIILYGIHLRKELPIELELASKAERKYILGQLDKLNVYSSKAKSGNEVNMNMLDNALSTVFILKNSQFLE